MENNGNKVKETSRALQKNIAEYSVDVAIDAKYAPVQEVMSRFHGLQEGLTVFLKEVCHPYKNWPVVVKDIRTYALNYFYVLKTQPKGPDTALLYAEILLDSIERARQENVKKDAYSTLFQFIQRLINDTDEHMPEFYNVLEYCFTRIGGFPDELMSIVGVSYYRLRRLAEDYCKKTIDERGPIKPLVLMLEKYLQYSYKYWLSVEDTVACFGDEFVEIGDDGVGELFSEISHKTLKRYKEACERVGHLHVDFGQKLKELITFPGFSEIVKEYELIPTKISALALDEKVKYNYEVFFLFHTLNISGLSSIHEESLRQINRKITWLISNEDFQHVRLLIQRSFSILKKSVSQYPVTVLKCILHLGTGVYETRDSDLVLFFNEELCRIGFQSPDFAGVTTDWQIQSNTGHIENIRTWLTLIGMNPRWSVKLLSSLIIHLSLTGVLIKDTDLFQREITRFLNSEIAPVYNLVKQLMRIFPVYFNELGAEGQLRDISTRIDEACARKDKLIHFLRKQCHVESSNKIISLIEAVLTFWKTKTTDELKPYLPPDIYEQIELSGPYIDGVHKVMDYFFNKKTLKTIPDILTMEDEYFVEVSGEIPKENRDDFERVALAISLYKLLSHKYSIGHGEIESYILQVQTTSFPDFKELIIALQEKDVYKKLDVITNYLETLKKLILSAERFEIREDIYRKRHISAEIPSMYGTYHEVKFDALGLTFRLEALANTLFEALVDTVDLSFITRSTFYQIYRYLRLFQKMLDIEGIPVREFHRQLDIFEMALEIRGFSFTQFLDIFRTLSQVVGNIVTDHFNYIHKDNLQEILSEVQRFKLLPKYLHGGIIDNDEFDHKVSEIFLRDIIAASPGILTLDLFLTKILTTLHMQAEKLPEDKHYLFVNYNPHDSITSIEKPADRRAYNIIYLGNKGFNLKRMYSFGLPIPEGFIITTEVFRCLELLSIYTPAMENFRAMILSEVKNIERLTGKGFGRPSNPLLLSVRSGSTVSQPGMMDSYLNVGINEEIVDGLSAITGNGWFAWDCYRRYLQSYGMSFGCERNDFDAIIGKNKEEAKVLFKKDLTPEQMKATALSYRTFVESKGINVNDDPSEQLFTAIERVFNSWNTKKAKTYRKLLGISDDWGTAVTVQAMVYGNKNRNAGSGVLFTQSPKVSATRFTPWGDYTFGNQGDDVVSGLVYTYPISIYQAYKEGREVEYCLERKFPKVYQRLREIAKILIFDRRWSPQDIEFTFEGPEENQVYILQSRELVIRQKKTYPVFELDMEMQQKLLVGHGVGVNGGAMAGRVVFNVNDIKYWRIAEPKTPLILVRQDTVPDDIVEISQTDGLLTARGGATSHASIVATRLDKTCVVGCADMVCHEGEGLLTIRGIDVLSGEFISIDGTEGAIYLGAVKISGKGGVE